MTEFDYTAEGVLRIQRGQKQHENAPIVKRVAAYCRVSTDLEQQQSSLATQMESFQELIAAHMGWELAGIYADADTSYGQNAKRSVSLTTTAPTGGSGLLANATDEPGNAIDLESTLQGYPETSYMITLQYGLKDCRWLGLIFHWSKCPSGKNCPLCRWPSASSIHINWPVCMMGSFSSGRFT